MKREFLKELGLGGDQIEKIMAEHGKSIDKIKQDTDSKLTTHVVDGYISASGTKSPEILKLMLEGCNADDAGGRIAKYQTDYPWLFRQSLPTFSAPCESAGNGLDPFRYGAGL